MTVTVPGINDDDPDDPIVWRADKSVMVGGKLQFKSVFMRRSDEARLLAAFGRKWLDDHIVEMQREVDNWGVH